jgi:formate dehydrogenase iron-sulfur subunit
MPIGDGSKSGNQARHDHVARGTTVGFLTDPTLCIGCKACEVACKEYNRVPQDGLTFTGNSYDNTGTLGANSWRHVKFVELDEARGVQLAGPMDGGEQAAYAWVFLSDVCKHCEHAGCLEACPTGAIIRNEVGAVYVQDDVCNGCGYCVVSCPFGVIDRRQKPLPEAGGAYKCTFCYDRQIEGLVPACAKACPTESIRFGPLSELRNAARERIAQLEHRGYGNAALYDPQHSSVGGTHALFITLGSSERFNLPENPVVPTVFLEPAWRSALFTSLAALVAAWLAFTWLGA